MEFRILGPLEVLEAGEPVAIGRRKHRQLLALLVINVNRLVTTDRILEELWGADAEGKENALWVYISRLRAILGEPETLVTRDHGYSLVVDEDNVDAHRFESAVEAGRALLKDDPAAASSLLSDGLDLWRGPALEEFAYDDFAQPEITRLEEVRLAALGHRIEADLRRGLAGELVGELEVLQSAHPTQEAWVSQLMLALYRCGRQTDALRAFERFRLHIGENSGLEPSPELRLLEEQVLLHDPRIQARPTTAGSRQRLPAAGPKNPYKGLRAFGENDSGQFFGRARLVAEIVRRLENGVSLIGLVGPSGSGKSSVVRAGVIPALRKGAISESDEWVIATMVPSAHPFVELEAALARTSLDAPDNVVVQRADTDTAILRAILRVMPAENSRLVLVIDQFEELFTLVDDENERAEFMKGLLQATQDPHGRVKVMFTLRADFYDRPLAYPDFGAQMGQGVVNVVPLSPDELEAAARHPAEEVGVSLEPSLVVALLGDVIGQAGGLPLFQYALTELFDRRTNEALTLATYQAMDGVRGALSRRAEDLYAGLDPEQGEAARQMFLRLVTIADGDEWGRRRVHGSEIIALDVDVIALQTVIDVFTRHRLLTLNRDAATGSPTVEVAHEALLTQWDRLRGWIDGAREDLKRHSSLTTALSEWNDAGRDPDYLLSGTRLDAYEQWASASTMKLTSAEQGFLGAGGDRRDDVERERLTREAGAKRSTRRTWAVAVALLILVGVIGAALLTAGPSDPVQVTAFGLDQAQGESVLDQETAGYARAELELNVEVERLNDSRFSDLEDEYTARVQAGTDLIFMDNFAITTGWIEPLIAGYPDTAFVTIEPFTGRPEGSLGVFFADEQIGFIAGAAAALKSETGVIGYIGGIQFEGLEAWRSGYETGARSVRPDIRVLATYASNSFAEGFESVDRVRAVAGDLYQKGADVVHAAAGTGSLGAIEAARQYTNETGTHVWAITPDSDWSLEIDDSLQAHLLTSAIKKFDTAVFEVIRQYTAGEFNAGERTLTLASGAIALARSDHLSSGQLRTIDELIQQVVDGTIVVPRLPTGELLPPFDGTVSGAFTVTWDGTACTYSLDSETLNVGATANVRFVNETTESPTLLILHRQLPSLQLPSQPMGTATGYLTLEDGQYGINCGFASGPNAPWITARTIQAE